MFVVREIFEGLMVNSPLTETRNVDPDTAKISTDWKLKGLIPLRGPQLVELPKASST